MTHLPDETAIDPRWPLWWRLATIALGVLILCSCQSAGERARRGHTGPPADLSGTAGVPETLPPEAWSGIAPGMAMAYGPAVVHGPPGMEMGVPLPYEPVGPWSPPGIARPWPPEEYLRDGGDAHAPAGVNLHWQVHGLDPEDTIAHFDTLDGRTVVEPSNRVHIYAPRFGAVRQVVSLVANEQHEILRTVDQPAGPQQYEEQRLAQTGTQRYQADGQVGVAPPVVFRSRQGDGAMSSAAGLRAFQVGWLPYENLRAIREGVVEASEAAMLAKGAQAAIAWEHRQAVQILLDRQAATAEVSDVSVQSIYTVGQPPGNPRLRLIKVASTPFAEPGEEIDFTLRFDNVGNQLIGNVTIIDSLSGRLEYVEQSAQCSLDATFSTEPNEAGSLVVRCEVTDPLEPGQGGVIRFRCRVR
jgi:uncharacterized repeat protein (TIGR01451 family)